MYQWTPEEWEKTAKDYLKAVQEAVTSSIFVPCASCRIARRQESVGEVRNFEPSDPKIRARMRGPAVYIVCKECMGFPKEILEEKVTSFFVDRDAQVDVSQRLFEPAEATPATEEA